MKFTSISSKVQVYGVLLTGNMILRRIIFCHLAGTSTIANGTVRVLTTPAVSNIQINKVREHQKQSFLRS